MIIREKYLEKIRPFYEQDLIKVIVGVRRCGKSVLLTQIVDELKAKGVEDNQIIYINFEFEKYSDLLNHHEFHNYIEKQIIGDKKFYLFFDEIQKVDKWELAVNSFKAMFGEKVSIFVTGSNSDLLSGELATHIAGRYVSFKVYPFTFKEICEFKKIDDKNIYELKNEFDDYLLWGGMPQRVTLTDEDQFRTYLSDIYDSVTGKYDSTKLLKYIIKDDFKDIVKKQVGKLAPKVK